MSNRPSPQIFARYSYYLAFVSSGIILLSLLLSAIPGDVGSVLVNVVWLAFISGIAGTFMGWAATSDFKRRPADDESIHQARIGFRINLGATIVMVLMALIGVVMRILSSISAPIQ